MASKADRDLAIRNSPIAPQSPKKPLRKLPMFVCTADSVPQSPQEIQGLFAVSTGGRQLGLSNDKWKSIDKELEGMMDTESSEGNLDPAVSVVPLTVAKVELEETSIGECLAQHVGIEEEIGVPCSTEITTPSTKPHCAIQKGQLDDKASAQVSLEGVHTSIAVLGGRPVLAGTQPPQQQSFATQTLAVQIYQPQPSKQIHSVETPHFVKQPVNIPKPTTQRLLTSNLNQNDRGEPIECLQTLEQDSSTNPMMKSMYGLQKRYGNQVQSQPNPEVLTLLTVQTYQQYLAVAERQHQKDSAPGSSTAVLEPRLTSHHYQPIESDTNGLRDAVQKTDEEEGEGKPLYASTIYIGADPNNKEACIRHPIFGVNAQKTPVVSSSRPKRTLPLIYAQNTSRTPPKRRECGSIRHDWEISTQTGYGYGDGKVLYFRSRRL
ncbi:hypothetical protein K504DRAFT_506627 [Pleomassaria siparia CBS 279.74]|uniref:Uncharacterized protein n=1 Tax=Pleomassaria siparia CBS 279.74 TaxID=1314801 RepID=A0A6G1JWU7_9PLEO|nr:hypothetical protein K504DRAFT_506627 [Pleomassaria siparia CBS 279.74]